MIEALFVVALLAAVLPAQRLTPRRRALSGEWSAMAASAVLLAGAMALAPGPGDACSTCSIAPGRLAVPRRHRPLAGAELDAVMGINESWPYEAHRDGACLARACSHEGGPEMSWGGRYGGSPVLLP